MLAETMSVKSRLAKLETTMAIDSDPTQLAIFFEAPGIEPTGYNCDGVEIIREPGESIEAFKKRAIEAVAWPDAWVCHIFDWVEEVTPNLTR
jgi:hypothetical protein